MLFTYQFIQHDILKMHSYIEYIFYHVWRIAPDSEYGINLYENNEELKSIITDMSFSTHEVYVKFLSDIQKIFNLFKELSKEDIDKLSCWFESNNNIENLCSNTPDLKAYTYIDVNEISEKLSEELKTFFTGLYSKILGKEIIKNKIGDIDDHYKKFMKLNKSLVKSDICPYCGLSDTSNHFAETREAYDHFIPKSEYPFNSINFKNLAPMCHKCNSSYKGTKDPLHKNGARRKSYFSYKNSDSFFMPQVSITINTSDLMNLRPENIEVTIISEGFHEEIETWIDVYDIVDRYKEKLCGEDAKDWVQRVLDESDNYSERKDFLNKEIRYISAKPLNHLNFLKKAFYEAIIPHIRELSS